MLYTVKDLIYLLGQFPLDALVCLNAPNPDNEMSSALLYTHTVGLDVEIDGDDVFHVFSKGQRLNVPCVVLRTAGDKYKGDGFEALEIGAAHDPEEGYDLSKVDDEPKVTRVKLASYSPDTSKETIAQLWMYREVMDALARMVNQHEDWLHD